MAKLAFYTNESVHIAVAEGLKRRGIEGITARDAGNLRLSDEEQLEYAKEKNLVIVTHDVDFLSLAMKLEHNGIVFVHLQKYSIGDLIRNLKFLWDVAEQTIHEKSCGILINLLHHYLCCKLCYLKDNIFRTGLFNFSEVFKKLAFLS